jgi:hypothetical protein
MAGELLAEALVSGDDAWRLLGLFKLPWNRSFLGPIAAQALFHGHTVFDGSMALWHRCRPTIHTSAARRMTVRAILDVPMRLESFRQWPCTRCGLAAEIIDRRCPPVDHANQATATAHLASVLRSSPKRPSPP